MTPSRLDWMYTTVAALGAVGAGVLMYRFRRGNPEEAERRRRARVGRIGRLAQCEILDILEDETAPPATKKAARLVSLFAGARTSVPASRRSLVVYRYTISGVSYETTQDVPELSVGSWLPVPGQVASIKYDPANPSSSILMNRSWPAAAAGPSKPVPPEKRK